MKSPTRKAVRAAMSSSIIFGVVIGAFMIFCGYLVDERSNRIEAYAKMASTCGEKK